MEPRGFRNSEERRRMNDVINWRVQNIDFDKPSFDEKVMDLTKEALVAASGRETVNGITTDTRQVTKNKYKNTAAMD